MTEADDDGSQLSQLDLFEGLGKNSLIRPVRGFKTLKTAYATIMGFEVMRGLRKGQAAIFNLTQDIRGKARIVLPMTTQRGNCPGLGFTPAHTAEKVLLATLRFTML